MLNDLPSTKIAEEQVVSWRALPVVAPYYGGGPKGIPTTRRLLRKMVRNLNLPWTTDDDNVPVCARGTRYLIKMP